MVSSSRHILARIPSISFPTRMIDGVRSSISSHSSSSQSKSIQKEEIHHPKSGEKRDNVKVLVSEEECDIINVRSAKQTLSFSMCRAFVYTARPLPSFCDIIERTFRKALKISYLCEYVCLLTLSLSHSLTLSIKMGGYRPELDVNAADDNEPYKPSH